MPILGILASSAPAAAGTAFESIATATGTGSSNTITFSSIPSTYQHLQIRWLSRSTRTANADSLQVTLNSASSTYAAHNLYGDGSTVVASDANGLSYITLLSGSTAANRATGIMGVGILDIHDYASTTKAKTLRAFHGYDTNGAGITVLDSGLWTSTSAITSITFVVGTSGNFTTDTTFALYGIKGA